MRKLCIVLFILVSSFSAHADLKQQKQAMIKAQINIELAALMDDLRAAEAQIAKLTITNEQIKESLSQLETWGSIQQEEKNNYYLQLVEASAEIAELKGTIDLQKASQEKIRNNYSKLKNVMGCLAGSLLAILCFRFLNPILSTISSITGPQTQILSYLLPLFSFGAGYLLIYLYF